MGKDWYPGCWRSQKWRLNHLYYILSKNDGLVRFHLNWAQEELHDNLHNKNTVLKARQLGMSTYTSLFIFDNCLFHSHYNAGIIDKGIDDAKEKLQKMSLAYDYMLNPPLEVGLDHVEDPADREAIAMFCKGYIEKKVQADIQAERANFSNGSSIRLGTSLRGGTLKLLHVSEFGYVANNNPQKAMEILSGGINAVPSAGCVIIESTHEGARTGLNYSILKSAMENQGKPMTSEDYKFFFFPWWKQEEYRLPAVVSIDPQMREYFSSLAAQGIKLDPQQMAWYAAKARVLGYRMKTEYPSTPEEAFLAQVEGAIYGSQIASLRTKGRVAAEFDVDDYHPLYVSWDVGLSDYTAMWLIQPRGDGKFYVVDYFCANNHKTSWYFDIVRRWEREYGQLIKAHLLPHDMSQREFNTELPRHNVFRKAGMPFLLVKKTKDTWQGIEATRDILPHCVFHRRCNEPINADGVEYMSGINALENYRTGPVGSNGVERAEPLHDNTSHGADAFRLFVEAYYLGYVGKEPSRRDEPVSRWERSLKKKKGSRVLGLPSYWET